MAGVWGQKKGIITELQRCSVHDGPGIRTTVFLKGCNLHCSWCHNPETLLKFPQIEYYAARCIGCGACVPACPEQALTLEPGGLRRDPAACSGCGQCVKACWTGARKLSGSILTAAEAAKKVLEDFPYFQASGGGMTISGGEPFCQAGFVGELLALCREAGVHTAIETNLDWNWEDMLPVLRKTDLVMFDVKVFDSAVHMSHTGRLNTRIIENVSHMGELDIPCIARTTVVPGVNDTEEEVTAIAALVGGLPNLLYFELLPFHPLGAVKYAALEWDWPMQHSPIPSPECLARLRRAAEKHCPNVRTGGR